MGASMIRVGELSPQPFELRKKFWQDLLKLELQWVEFSTEQISDPVALLKSSDVDGVLLPPEHSDAFLSSSARIPSEVREAGLVDSIVRQNGALWIRCFLRESIHQLILKRASKLDTHSIAYVTGADPLARACIGVAVQMGFKKIILVSEMQDEAQAMIDQYKKLFFGLEFRLLGEAELTSQPNNGSLLLNTLPIETGGAVLEDLTYLNFLNKEGIVVDLPLFVGSNPLLEEATHVGIRRLSGVEIWGLRDWFFIKTLMPALSIPSEEYLQLWSSSLQEENKT
jgi:shikimate 5-dehydrogenase